MKIVIAAAGSYGDVAPYTGLGARLREAGHVVAIATHDSFAPLVLAAGLMPRSLPGDPRGGGGPSMRTAAAFVGKLGAGLVEAVDVDTELLLLSATTAPLGWHLAEALGIPSLGVYLQPSEPTGEFAPPLGGARSLGRWGNRAAGRLAQRVVDRLYGDAVRALRSELDLPPRSARAARRRAEAGNWPILYGFSPALVSRPADWRKELQVVGNWWPYVPEHVGLPTPLADFLAAGPKPVFVGFGSMGGGGGGGEEGDGDGGSVERLRTVVVRALRRAKVRGVLATGWAGLAPGEGLAGDDILTVGEVPHALLFPHMAAVVHHAGAGTTAAALRAGVPAVPVPVAADQPFWAARLSAVGAGTEPVPFATLTKEGGSESAVARLGAEIERAVRDTGLHERAAAAALRMAGEDGAGAVVRAVAGLQVRL